MLIEKTPLPGVVILKPTVIGDTRGWFMETYSKKRLQSQGLYVDFIQDNHSFSAQKGIIRGLHFQTDPMAQCKLVRCTKGRILDVAVDLRRHSDTYLQWFRVELSAENKWQLLIPRGFAHGFQTLTEEVEVQYKVDNDYSKEHDRSIRYDDETIGVPWEDIPVILSEKDENAPTLKSSDVNFALRVLVTGGSGQLGFDVVRQLEQEGYTVFAPGREHMDLSDPIDIEHYFDAVKPDLIIHCAAYTAVDKAEQDQENCYRINVQATEKITEMATKYQAKLVYISTDYVMSDDSDQPMEVDHPTNPINYYGHTKKLGEDAVRAHAEHFIVRTAWIFGVQGKNFVRTMLKLAEKHPEVNVIADQFGSPTYTVDLASFISQLIKTKRYGTYHATNEGFCTWYDFAKEIMHLAGKSTLVKPIITAEYPTPAKRPSNSRLSKAKLVQEGFERLPSWQDALKRYIDVLKHEGEIE